MEYPASCSVLETDVGTDYLVELNRAVVDTR